MNDIKLELLTFALERLNRAAVKLDCLDLRYIRPADVREIAVNLRLALELLHLLKQ